MHELDHKSRTGVLTICPALSVSSASPIPAETSAALHDRFVAVLSAAFDIDLLFLETVIDDGPHAA